MATKKHELIISVKIYIRYIKYLPYFGKNAFINKERILFLGNLLDKTSKIDEENLKISERRFPLVRDL